MYSSPREQTTGAETVDAQIIIYVSRCIDERRFPENYPEVHTRTTFIWIVSDKIGFETWLLEWNLYEIKFKTHYTKEAYSFWFLTKKWNNVFTNSLVIKIETSKRNLNFNRFVWLKDKRSKKRLDTSQRCRRRRSIPDFFPERHSFGFCSTKTTPVTRSDAKLF